MLRATWFVLAGMGVVFATLGLLVLVMTVLNRWLGAKPAAKATDPAMTLASMVWSEVAVSDRSPSASMLVFRV